MLDQVELEVVLDEVLELDNRHCADAPLDGGHDAEGVTGDEDEVLLVAILSEDH